jgi:hypothetical protein
MRKKMRLGDLLGRIFNLCVKREDDFATHRFCFIDEASYGRDIRGKMWWAVNFRDTTYSIE